MNKNKQSKQVFQFVAPAAKSVELVGDFTHWHQQSIPLQRDPKGIWTASVALAPGTHRYRFIVDGEWRDDPACQSRAPNPFGSEDMLRQAA
jgi:1,4-alpha-glucan branching enzyme